MMMMMMMCKRLAQVPMLCVPMYNIKLAMMQKTTMFTIFYNMFSTYEDDRKRKARLPDEVFACNTTGISAVMGNPHFTIGIQVAFNTKSWFDLEDFEAP